MAGGLKTDVNPSFPCCWGVVRRGTKWHGIFHSAPLLLSIVDFRFLDSDDRRLAEDVARQQSKIQSRESGHRIAENAASEESKIQNRKSKMRRLLRETAPPSPHELPALGQHHDLRLSGLLVDSVVNE